MAFRWVNHKQTRDHEVRGGSLWSPIRNANSSSRVMPLFLCTSSPIAAALVPMFKEVE